MTASSQSQELLEHRCRSTCCRRLPEQSRQGPELAEHGVAATCQSAEMPREDYFRTPVGHCQCRCLDEEYEFCIRDEFLLERLIRIAALDDCLWFLDQHPDLVCELSIDYLERQMATTYSPLQAEHPALLFNRCARAKALLDRILTKCAEELLYAEEGIDYFRETLEKIGTPNHKHGASADVTVDAKIGGFGRGTDYIRHHSDKKAQM